MSPAEDPPWSPFPVQDWSLLPEDPLSHTAVDPNWGPPALGRRWWPPLVIFVIIGALIGTAAYAGQTVGLGDPKTAAAGYLPADGAATYERVETTRDLETAVSLQVTESARFSGVTGLLSTDTSFGAKILEDTFDERDTIRTWRTTTTQLNNPAAAYQSTRVYRTNAAVELLGESLPGAAYVYRPALVELPADVGAGQQWSGSGSASDILDYRADFRAEAADGCLLVRGELRYLTKQGQLGRLVNLERTWCPGQGLVSQTESHADVITKTWRTAAPDLGVPTTTAAPLLWTGPASWREHSFDTISIDPTYGEAPMSGVPKSLVPVRTDSGLVVRATSSNDLIALTPKTQIQWVSAWRSHLPGEILTLRAFGNVIIATTSERLVLAYSDAGVRLWELSLDEIAAAPPVRVSDHDVVLVDLAGEVRRLVIGTGAVVWQHSLDSDVTVAPAAGAGVVVVMDRGQVTTGLDATTGRQKWTLDLEGKAAGFVGETLVLLQDQTAHGVDPGTGERRWLRPFFGTFTDLATVGDRLVLATQSATVLLDATGQVTGRLAPYLRLTVVGDRMVGWGTEQAELVDATGTVRTRWTLPSLTLAVQDRPAVATPQGVLLFNSDWTFQGWNDER